MTPSRPTRAGWRSALVSLTVAPMVLSLTGCFSGSSSSSSGGASPPGAPGQQLLTGTFVDSPVAGLDYRGTDSEPARTDSEGQFQYREGDTITFSIGDLELGSAIGAEVVTPLDIVSGAGGAGDQRVTNILTLLQTLDVDGDLNNGIQLTDQIRDEVSSNAGMLTLDQAPNDFRQSLEPIVESLHEEGLFTDLDPRPRRVVDPEEAIEHFNRSTGERITVSTAGGELRGFAANERTWQFLGIPYAQPPVGDLRWRPPVQAEPWEGVREAISWANQAAQDPSLEAINNGGMSEDSLYLNITMPRGAEDLPVMVWFHGGAFTILSGNSDMYNNPNSLTEKDVVLVTVNHRLGPFGYIAHPLLSEESGYEGSGNYGQMDLVMALEWVRDNIEAFGGDPDNVTIFGQSGGGGKVYSLMNSPLATGLFHKAIVMAGASPLDPTSLPSDSLAESEAVGAALFDRVGVSTLEEARALPWTAFTDADRQNDIPRQVYRPNVDYYYQPKTSYQNVVDGMPSDVPLMSGVTSGDYDTLRAALPIWLRQRSDAYQSNQYIYRFSRVPEGWRELGLLSCHGCELPYLFNYPRGMVSNFQLGLVLTPEGNRPVIGDLNNNGVTGTQGDPEDILTSMRYGESDEAVADLMMTMFSNFARTGDPSVAGLAWPPYTNANDTYVEIGPDTTATVETGLVEGLR